MNKTNCNHKKKISLYGRKEHKWISPMILRGNMIYCCEICGAIIEENLVEVKVVKIKKEVK